MKIHLDCVKILGKINFRKNNNDDDKIINYKILHDLDKDILRNLNVLEDKLSIPIVSLNCYSTLLLSKIVGDSKQLFSNHIKFEGCLFPLKIDKIYLIRHLILQLLRTYDDMDDIYSLDPQIKINIWNTLHLAWDRLYEILRDDLVSKEDRNWFLSIKTTLNDCWVIPRYFAFNNKITEKLKCSNNSGRSRNDNCKCRICHASCKLNRVKGLLPIECDLYIK